MAKKSKKQKDYLSLDENRYGLFMNENSFNLEIMYGREFIKTDVNFKIKLYRINILETETDDLYGETKPSEKKFFPPVWVNGIVDIEPSTQKYFAGSTITRDDSGNLKFSVYIKELEELNIDITRGDIIAYNLSGEKERYYEVSNADNVIDSSEKTIAAMKPYWKIITAVPVKSDVVPFI